MGLGLADSHCGDQNGIVAGPRIGVSDVSILHQFVSAQQNTSRIFPKFWWLFHLCNPARSRRSGRHHDSGLALRRCRCLYRTTTLPNAGSCGNSAKSGIAPGSKTCTMNSQPRKSRTSVALLYAFSEEPGAVFPHAGICEVGFVQPM